MSLVSTNRFKTSIDIDLNKHIQTNLWSQNIYMFNCNLYTNKKMGHIYLWGIYITELSLWGIYTK